MIWGNANLEVIRGELQSVSERHGYRQWQTTGNLKKALADEIGGLDVNDKVGGGKSLCAIMAVAVRLADEMGVDLVSELEERLGKKLEGKKRGERPVPLDSSALQKLEKEKELDTSAKGGIASNRPAFKRTLSVVCDLKDPTMLYSPTHFCHDLFSPVTSKKDFDVEYNTRQPLLPVSLSKQSLLTTEISNSPLSPNSLGNFFPMVETLESTNFTEEELASLDLTFCAPMKGKIVDLVEGGVSRPVKKDTFTLFVKLAKELAAEGNNYRAKKWDDVVPKKGPFATAAAAASQQAQGAGGPKRMKRTLSVQPLSKWNAPEQEENPACFSPTHFQHDLFSPVSNKTDFEVDYSEFGATKTLPASLSKHQLPDLPKSSITSSPPPPNKPTTVSPRSPGKRLTPVQSVRRPSVASFGSDEEDEHKGLELLCEVAEERQRERARKNKLDFDQGFLPAIEDIEKMLKNNEINATDLQEMNLTFCIPDKGQLHDLVPDGRETRVTIERLPEFISLAKRKKREIEAAEG